MPKTASREDIADELSKSIEPKIWWLLSVATRKSYPLSLEDKYQFILDLISK